MDTVSKVYNKYLKSFENFNTIFGEGNWAINNYVEQSMIYCAFFELQFPASFKHDFSKDNLYIGFIDNPTFQKFHEKHPKLDKTKPLSIHSSNNNEKFIIRAIMIQNIDKSSYVVLNKLNVCKLNVLHFSILKNIKNNSINDNYKLINYYCSLNNIILRIIDMTDTIRNEKDVLKEKHMKAIAKIDEICSIDICDKVPVNPIQTNVNIDSSTEASNETSSAESSNETSSVEVDDEPPAKKTMEN